MVIWETALSSEYRRCLQIGERSPELNLAGGKKHVVARPARTKRGLPRFRSRKVDRRCTVRVVELYLPGDQSSVFGPVRPDTSPAAFAADTRVDIDRGQQVFTFYVFRDVPEVDPAPVIRKFVCPLSSPLPRLREVQRHGDTVAGIS